MPEDVISIDEFLELPEEAPRRSKVDYEAVLAEIEGKPMTISAIKEVMLKHSTNKPKVYYSEVTNWLERLAASGKYDVLVRYGDKKYVLVRRKE